MEKNLIKICLLALTLALLLGAGATLAPSASETSLSDQVPLIPERPETSASQTNAYEELPLVGQDASNFYGKPYGAWNSGSNPVQFLSDMTYITSSNTPNKTYPNGQPTTVNHPYSAQGHTFWFGSPSTGYEYTTGISMHPKNPNEQVFDRQDSWTVYDISELTSSDAAKQVDTFYALVGLVSVTNDYGSRYNSAGVYVYIYGDKIGDGEHYELLAESGCIRGDVLGEFCVNVVDVKLLVIDVILPETATSHAYSAVGFGNACLFKADENAQKPDYTGDFLQHQHTYGEWQQHSATQHKSVCPTCQDTVYGTHSWDDGKITTKPTCTDSGVRTYTCTDCDYWKVDNVAPTHECFDWIADSETQHRRICACGQYTEYLDHVYDNDSDPTCDSCGYQRTIVSTSEQASQDGKGGACTSTVTIGTGLTLLLTIASAGWIFKKED